MKNIQHFSARIDARCLFALIVLFHIRVASAVGVSFSSLSEDYKNTAVKTLYSCGGEVGFIVTYESGAGYCWYRDKTALPLSSSFGLAQANTVLSSEHCGSRMTNGLVRCYIYGEKERFYREEIGTSGSEFFCASCFDDCVCRIAFVKPQKVPLEKRFRPFMSRSLASSRTLVDFDSVWDYEIRAGLKIIDKQAFLSAFSNNVWKVSGGVFAVKADVARKVIVHDYRKGCARPSDFNRIETEPRLGDIIVLDSREISEIVYWLWDRKGKRGEYAGFVREHPELFEPIADVSEFQTELGKRLLGTWE